MPELPLVERFRSEAERFLRNRTIQRAVAVRDELMMPDLTPRKFIRAMTGQRIVGVERRGKYVWLRCQTPPHLVLHFGMTGEFVYGAITRPKHWRIELTLDNGGIFTLVDSRRFGRVLLANDPRNEPPVRELGFDPWSDHVSPTNFTATVRKRTAPIKAILLDQAFAAGVGNWIADDALYLAGIDPRRRGNSLSAVECRRLLCHLLSVVRVATKVGNHADRFPSKWLFHLRWGRHHSIHTADGSRVRFERVGGRTTVWVPKRQK